MKCHFVAGAVALSALAFAQPSTTSRMTLRSTGQQLALWVTDVAVNADARYCAFSTADSGVVSGDTNGVADVFVRDTLTGIVTRVSVSSTGGQANGASSAPSMSSGGRFIAFVSSASNLVSGDTNGVDDIFVHDRETGITSRISISSAGEQADGPSSEPFINGNGRYVAFTSAATNLVGDDDNGVSDIFVRKLNSRITECASRSQTTNHVGNGHSRSPSMDITGSLLSYSSEASNIYQFDTNGVEDVFVRFGGQSTRISRGNGLIQGDGPSYDPHVSPDGTYIVYASEATNFFTGDTNGVADLFLFDMFVFGTEHVEIAPAGSQPNGHSWAPKLSYGGRQIAFVSAASNLAPSDNNGVADVFVIDRQSNLTTIASKSSLGVISSAESRSPQVSANGKVAFVSIAANLVPFDTNGIADAFLHDIFTVRPTAINVGRGFATAGGLNSTVYADDDSSLAVRPGIVFGSMQDPIVIEAESTVIRTTPIALSSVVRSSSNSGSIRQTIEWFDFVENRYILVDARVLSTSFSDATVSFGYQNADRFVSPNGSVRIRVSMRAVGPTLVYPWEIRIDQIKWVIYD